MSAFRTAHPRLALPFTVVADGELLHLIGGEDVRYSVRAGSLASGLAVLLRHCDGRDSLDTLLFELPEAERSAARQLVERLYGERVLIDGPVEELSVANHYRLDVEGRGELAKRLAGEARDGPALSVLCQDTLDLHAVLEFNGRCLRAGAGPWMWATTGPASRGFVSPVFLPQAGPCLECLVRHFQRLSPAPQLYEALARHGKQGGIFAAMPFPSEGLAILEQIVLWKLGQLSSSVGWDSVPTGPVSHVSGRSGQSPNLRTTGSPNAAVFQLHVLELDSLEVSTHRVFLDPTCPECAHARLV